MSRLSELKDLKAKAIMELQRLYKCDIFLCPVFPLVAPLTNDYYHHLIPAFAYTVYWNVLEMPAGVVPHGLVNSDEAIYKDSINDHYEYIAKQTMKGSTGLPIGVQIVGNCY